MTFLNAAAVDTRATFSFAGTYVLRLTASDSALGNSDTVQVTVQPAPPPGGVTFERRVVAGSDDAEESASGGMSLTSSDLELVYDGSNQRVGMRFTSVAVPRGATITHAYLQFEADETQSELTNLAIQGQAADNAAVFGSASGNISTRRERWPRWPGRRPPGGWSARPARTSGHPSSRPSCRKSSTAPVGRAATHSR